MNEDHLARFYSQTELRKVVQSYMHDLLDELALKEIYSEDGETYGFEQANRTIDKLFDTLEARYGEKNSSRTTNQAK